MNPEWWSLKEWIQGWMYAMWFAPKEIPPKG